MANATKKITLATARDIPFDKLSLSQANVRRIKAGIRAHAPQDVELHRIAEALQQVQRRNFYQLRAETSLRGHYCHARSMVIAVARDSPTGQEMTEDAEEVVADALRDQADWLYRQLQREYDYLTSDAAIDEVIRANDYSFTAEGRRFG